MNTTTKLALIEKNHEEILEIFSARKENLLQAFDDFFSCFLANPFKINYSKVDRQNYFELYLALKKQVSLMEYMPDTTKRFELVKANDEPAKNSQANS